MDKGLNNGYDPTGSGKPGPVFLLIQKMDFDEIRELVKSITIRLILWKILETGR